MPINETGSGDQRNEGGAPALEEEEDNDNDQKDRFQQRVHNLFHAFGYRKSSVKRDRVVQTLGENVTLAPPFAA